MFKKILVILIIGFISFGCGAKHSSGPAIETVFFFPKQDPVANSIYITQDSIEGSEIQLSIKAKEISNVYGASFTLEYNPAIVSYVPNSAKEGDFFESNTMGFQAQLENANQGRLVVGIARKRTSTQQGKTGSGKIGQVKFKVLAKNKTDMNFVSNELKDFQENKITAVWIGGEIGGD